jgi:hypothetical protein
VEADANGIEHSSKITFSVPDTSSLSVDSAYEPIWLYDVRYELDGNTHQILRISENIFTHEIKQTVLANEITALNFSRKTSAPGLITITVSAQRVLSNGQSIPETPLQMTAQAEARNP